MALFSIKPFSMSILVSNEDAQPKQLAKAGALIDDDTRTWLPVPGLSGYLGELVKSNNPLLISFKLPQQVCSLTNPIKQLNLSLRCNNIGGITGLRAILLPFVAKRANATYTNNRTIGFRPSVVQNFVANQTLGYVETPLSSGNNITASFANSFPSIVDRTIRAPKWMEYIRTLASSDADPILTFCVYPSTDVGNLYITEPDSSDLSTLIAKLDITTDVADTTYNNDANNTYVNPSMLAPVIAIKQTSIGAFDYSMGVGQDGTTHVKPDNSAGILDKSIPLGEMLERSANLTPQFIVDTHEKTNLATNGKFFKAYTSMPIRGLYGEPYSNQGTIVTACGWRPYSRTATPTATILCIESFPYTTGLYATNFCIDPLKYADDTHPHSINLLDVSTTDATNSTAAWKRSISEIYWQYTTLAQDIGCQLEEEEWYLLEAWVKPYYARKISGEYSNNCKIRLAYTTGFQSDQDLSNGSYATHYTGDGSSSVDASFPIGNNAAAQLSNSTWQRLWVKIKVPKSNSLQRSLAFYKNSDNISIEARELLVSDPPFFDNSNNRVSEKTSHGEIRLDVIPSVDTPSTTYRYDTKFLVTNVSLVKLHNREYSSDSLPFMNNSPATIEIKQNASSLSSISMQNIDYYLPLRGESTSPYNTSMFLATQNSWKGIDGELILKNNDKWVGLDRIDRLDAMNLGGPFASPRYEYLYYFSPSFNGTGINKFNRGAHLGINLGDRVSILNPNEGSISFWYSPVKFNYVDPNNSNSVVAMHGRPITKASAGTELYYRPWAFNSRYGDENVTNDVQYAVYKNYLWIGSPKHIMSFLYAPIGWTTDTYTSKYWNGGTYSGTCVSFFRQGRMIYCLISETGWFTTPWQNQAAIIGSGAQRDKARYILLKYRIPDSLYKAKNIISDEDTIPSWFNIKLVWGARQELYVNGELVDYNNISGLFLRPSRLVKEYVKNHNNYPNALWIGQAGVLSSDSTWLYPQAHSDAMILSDILISSKANHQTKMASSLTDHNWLDLENKYTVGQSTAGGATHAYR